MADAGESLRRLREAVLAAPDDLELRRRVGERMAADGVERGELILVQLALRLDSPNPTRRRQLRERQAELVGRQHRMLGSPRSELRFRGGFVEAVDAEAQELGALAPLLAHEPVRSMDLASVDDAGVRRLIACPAWGRLETLKLRGKVRRPGLEALAASPGLRSITTLNLLHCALGLEDLEPLLGSPHLRVRRLTLTSHPLGERGAEMMVAPVGSGWRGACQELFVARCALGNAGARTLLGPGTFPHLARLGVGGNELDDGCLEDVNRALANGAVDHIELEGNAIEWKTVRILRERWGERVEA